MTAVHQKPLDLPWLHTLAEQLVQMSEDRAVRKGYATKSDPRSEVESFTGQVQISGTRVSYEFATHNDLNGDDKLFLVLDMENGSAYLSDGSNSLGVSLQLSAGPTRA